MKKVLFTLFFMLLVMVAVNSAQSNVISVAPGIGTLNKAILGDTTAAGKPKDATRIYSLKRGGYYILNGQIQPKNGFHLRLIGEPAPATGKDPGPAVIMPGTRDDGGLDYITFNLYGDITFQNIWFLYWTTTDARGWITMNWNADGARAQVDNCVFEWSQAPAITILGKDMKLFKFTNSIFRNSVDPTQWWAGRMCYFNSVGVDTVWCENNTFINEGFDFQLQNYGLRYFWWNHNTHVNTAKFVFLNEQWQKAYITNNLFINGHFTGERVSDRGGQDPDGFLYGSVINIDTLTASSTFKEADREFVYANNVQWRDTWLDAYYDSYNANPLHTDPILPQPPMNPRTKNMFTWHPKFKNTNNIGVNTRKEGIDPKITKMPNNKQLMLDFMAGRFETSTDVDWGWDGDPVDPTSATANHMLCGWPIYEDLSYTDATVLANGLGGYPVGDLRWFPAKRTAWEAQAKAERAKILTLTAIENEGISSLPSDYKLEGNYPNPFNPSTTISFTTPVAGSVKLVIYNMLGQEVRTLVNGDMSAGSHRVQWDGRDSKGAAVTSGVYFYQMSAGNGFTATQKMMLMK